MINRWHRYRTDTRYKTCNCCVWKLIVGPLSAPIQSSYGSLLAPQVQLTVSGGDDLNLDALISCLARWRIATPLTPAGNQPIKDPATACYCTSC